MKKLLHLFLLLALFTEVHAQNVTVTPDGITPASGTSYPRISYAAILALPNPQEGDLAYDTTNKCLRLYSAGEWLCTNRNPLNYVPNITDMASAGGQSADRGDVIAVDDSGNVYIAGNYKGTVNWGSGTLTSLNNSEDIFLAKYNQSGVLQWVRSAGGNSNDQVSDISVDTNGNVYIIGYFVTGTATFGSITVTGAASLNYFLTKYNSSGTAQWVKQASSSYYGIKIDAGNNLYLAGNYAGTVTFGSTTLTSQGSSDVFVAKYDSDGNVLWVKSAGGANFDYPLDIDLDKNGKVYIIGEFRGTFTLGSISKTAQGESELFLAKYDPVSGNWLWAEKAQGYKIAVDQSENTYTIGTHAGSTVFGSGALITNGGNDVFLAKYNFNGALQWVRSAGGAGDDSGKDITVDVSGNVYITGYYSGTAKFGSKTKTSQGGKDIFVAKYYSNSFVQWLQTAGGSSMDGGQGIIIGKGKYVYITGYYSGTATFGNSTRTSNGDSDIFILRLD